jgi:PKD-like domain
MHNATVANEPVGATGKEYLWTVTPTSALAFPVGTGNQLYMPRWANTPNTPTRSIKVKVTWKDGNGATVATAESIAQTVIVKHIAPITSMTFTGAVSANPTNGGTVNVSCGSQSFVATIPTPVTNPTAGVVFTWSLPSGWSGSSTSNTISITSDAGTGGTITVSARRTDGTITQSYSVNITRPTVGTPTILTANGNPLSKAICPASQTFYYNGIAANSTSFSWTTGGGIAIYGASTNQFTAINGNSKGTLTFTADNACQSPQSQTVTIYAGAPTPETATVNGGSLSTPNYIYNPALLNVWTNETNITYAWQITNGTGSIYYNGQNSVSAYAYPFVRIEATLSNSCGTGGATTFYLYDISGGYYRMASPNPATSTVSADVVLMGALKTMTLVSDTRSTIVRTFNPATATNSDTQRANNTVSFDVSRLVRGRYYLNFAFEGGKTFTEQIILE